MVKQELEETKRGDIKERRRSERRPFKEAIGCSLCILESGRLVCPDFKSDIINISNLGVSIRTFYPLEPGQLLIFTIGMENKAGVVKWCKVMDETYQVGIEFIETESPLH